MHYNVMYSDIATIPRGMRGGYFKILIPVVDDVVQVDAVEPFQVEQRRVLLRAVDSCGRRRGRPVNPVDLHNNALHS